MTNSHTLTQATLIFDGPTFDAALDGSRLTSQFCCVETLMSDGHWRTLSEIAESVRGSESGLSARLRDLRKVRFGSHVVERRLRKAGLWEYRVR